MKNKNQQELLDRVLLYMSYDTKKTLTENLSKIYNVISEEATSSAGQQSSWGPPKILNQDTNLKAPKNMNGYQTIELPAGTKYWTWGDMPDNLKNTTWNFTWKGDTPQYIANVLKTNPFSTWFPDDSVMYFITPDNKNWKFWIRSGEDKNVSKTKYIPLWFTSGEGQNGTWYDPRIYNNKIWVPRGEETDKNIISLPYKRNPKLLLTPDPSSDNFKEGSWYFEKADDDNQIQYELQNLTTEKIKIDDARLVVGFGFETLDGFVGDRRVSHYEGKLVFGSLSVLEPGEKVKITFTVVFGENPKKKEKEDQERAKQENKNQEQGKSSETIKTKKEYPVEIQSLEDGTIQIDYSFATKQYEKEKEKRLNTETSFVLIVTTSAGSAAENVPVELSPTLQDERMMKKQMLRLREGYSVYGGLKVPEGFSPLTYDEYLEINKEIRTITEKWTYKESDGKNYWKSDTPQDQKDKYNQLLEKRKEITSSGNLTPENNKLYQQKNSQIEKLLSEFREKNKTYHPPSRQKVDLGPSVEIPGGYWFDYEMLSEEKKKEYDLLQENRVKLAEYYGVDLRSSFDKFIDDYGGWIQLGIGAVAIIASLGGATPFVTFMYGVDVAVGLGLGAYYLNRGDTANAVMSIFFAFLPQVHKLYKPITSFFKVAPDPNVALRLSEALSRQVFRSADDITLFRNFLKQTDPDMLKLFDEGLRVPKSMVGKVLEIGIDSLNQANKVAPLKLKAGLWTKTLTKGIAKFIPKMASDIVILHGIQKATDEISKKIKTMCPTCPVMTQEEYRMSQTYLDKLNEAEAVALFSIINSAMISVQSGEVTKEQAANTLKELAQGKVGKEQVKKFGAEILDSYQKGANENLNQKSSEFWNQVIEKYKRSDKVKEPINKTTEQKPINISGPGIGTVSLTGPGIDTTNLNQTKTQDDFETVDGKPIFMPEK